MTKNAASSYASNVLAAFDARKAYENDKNDENTSIQKTLDDLRNVVSHETISKIMHTAHVDADFINKSERKTNRFNVYAAQKVVNVAQAIAKASALNHYSRAILLSAKSFTENELTLTHRDAVAACSLQIKTDTKKQKHLVQYQKNVDASTASTQASSSINALKMYDVLREEKDAANVTCYKLNVESETTKALLALFN